MLGENARPLVASGWYVIAQDGDLVLRVRDGMQLGEDHAGELSFHPQDALVELNLADEGTLVLIAGSGQQFETESGATVGRVEVPRHSQVQISLIRSVLRLETDFAEASEPGDRVNLRTVPLPFDGTRSENVILVPEATPRTLPRQVDPAAARTQKRPESHSRVASRRTALVAVALGTAVTLGLLYFIARPQIESPLSGGAMLETPAIPATSTPPAPVATPAPDVAEALGTIGGLLDGERLPSDSALNVAVQSLKALVAAYPGDARVHESLEAMTERLATEAKLQHDQGDPALGLRLIELAATTGVGHEHVTSALSHIAASSPAPAERLPVEPVAAPAIERRSLPPDPTEVSPAPAEPPGETLPRTADAQEADEPRIDWDLLSQDVQAIVAGHAVERDLEAAAGALERGLLMPPTENNAFTLYNRVLASDPDSQAARAGLESVREALLTGARASLTAGDFDTAMAALDDAAKAGANELLVDDLRGEVSYRRRLLDARAGRFDALYPITRLKAIRQDPPVYPGYAAVGTERSIELEMTVSEAGEVRDVAVLGDPPRRFARAAKQAVSNWRFEPVLEDGRPMPVRTSVTMTFRRD